MTPILSLFSGIGGFDLGFARAGFRTCLAIDIDPIALATYHWNMPWATVARRDIAVMGADDALALWPSATPPIGVIGGPPCQGFSHAVLKGDGNDPRNELTSQYIALVRDLANRVPELSFFVFENVYGLLSMTRNQAYRERLFALLAELPFSVSVHQMVMWQYGVPQVRKRVIIVGIRNNRQPFVFPAGTSKPTFLPRDVFDVTPIDPDPSFHPNHYFSDRYGKRESIIQRVRANEIKPAGLSRYVINYNKPSAGITHKPYIHPSLLRRCTPYECLRLQTFPHSFVVFGSTRKQYQLIANAVPPNAAYEIALAIRSCYRTLSLS